MSILVEIATYRRPITPGGNPHRFVELINGEEVPVSFYEPSPKTFRSKYYYNARRNILYMKMEVKNPINGQTSIYWKRVSEY